MAHNNRGHCSKPDFRRSINYSEDFFYTLEGGFAYSEEISPEDQSIIYNNAMMLMGALDLAQPYSDDLEMDPDTKEIAQIKRYSAEVYLDKTSGEIKDIDYDGSVDPELANQHNNIKLMFTAEYEAAVMGEASGSYTATRFRFEPFFMPDEPEFWASVPDERADRNLQMTLTMLDEQ